MRIASDTSLSIYVYLLLIRDAQYNASRKGLQFAHVT